MSSPKISFSPPHPSRFRLVITASNSSCRSYSPAQISANTRFTVSRSFGSSVRLIRSRLSTDSALYEYLAHAATPAPPYAMPWSVPPAAAVSIVVHSWLSCSFTGTLVSVSTPARAAHRSTVPWPYWLIPSSTCVRGATAESSSPPDSSWPVSDRLCQNIAAASSMLSKKSSSEYRPAPQLPSTEW